LKGKAACLYLIVTGREELVPVAQKGLSEAYFRSRKSRLAREIVPLLQEEGYFYSQMAGTGSQVAQVEHPEAKLAEGIAAILAVPVWVKGRIIGIFCLFTGSPREFGEDEREFLMLLAQQGGGIMEHAHLIDQLRQKTKLFFDLAVNLSGSLDVKEILNGMTTNLAVALGVKAASIRLLDEHEENLELVASCCLSDKYLNKGPVSAKKSISQTLSGGQPVYIANAVTDKRVQYRQEVKEEGIVSILSVPIKTKEKVIGVLRLYSGGDRPYTKDEIMLVTTLAYLGGLAIQNASLYLMCQKDMENLQDELWSHRSWF
ncbi:MAG: GAF domain-containing protein, partial [Deltaproteobacteria bacterium]|nr:GAF domain-containing protein [Deltaproteobacteria bacterium]